MSEPGAGLGLGIVPGAVPVPVSRAAQGGLGLAGTLLGAVAAGAAAGVAAERYAVQRWRRRHGDRYADEPFGLLRADAEYTVHTPDGVPLHVEVVEPDGDPQLTVVFVHGFCLDMGTWHFQRQGLAGLADPRIRMVFYDQPGHGRSGRRPAGEYTIDQLGADLAVVIDQVAPEGPLVLAGHSMGGMAVMAFAERHPELVADRVVGVALISTSAGHLDDVALGLPPVLTRVRAPLMPALVRALRWQPALAEYGRRAGSDLAYLLTRRYGFGAAGTSPALVSYVGRMNASTAIEVIAGYLGTLFEHDRYAALEAFADVETLVVCGDRDLLTPVQHTREIARLLPHATLVEIPGGGHLTLMEHAAKVNAGFVGFLRRSATRVAEPRRRFRVRRGDEVAAKAERRAEVERRAKVERSGTAERRALRRILRRKGA